jgi:hypothetical protein
MCWDETQVNIGWVMGGLKRERKNSIPFFFPFPYLPTFDLSYVLTSYPPTRPNYYYLLTFT